MDGRRSGVVSLRSLLSIIAVVGLVLSASVTASRAASPQAKKPIKIGVSISLSGDFSANGQNIQRGYNLWASIVNKSGGILGRQVKFIYVDDASSTTQITTNIQKLINVDKVDLLFGPFSSLLTIPAAKVASRYGYAFPEPAGGGPLVFQAHLHNLFFVQPAPVANNLVSVARWLLSLKKKPKTAAYASEDDPFAKPQVDIARGILSKAGVRTVANDVFPSETTDYGPIALKEVHSKADVVLLGTTGLPEAVGFIKTFIQQHYNPKAVVESTGPDQGLQFAQGIGKRNTEGVLVPSGWWYNAKTTYNKQFVRQYVAKYGGKVGDISSDAAEAFSVGQVVAQAVGKIHSVNNTKLINELHRGTFKSILGNMRWNSLGEPQGQMFLVQWRGGKAVPVYPPAIALSKPEYPKPHWH